VSDERTPGGGPDEPRRGDTGDGGDLQGHDSFYDLSGEFDDPADEDAGSGAARPAAPSGRQHPVATRGEVLRAFLSSGTGGALVALAAVLLIVVTLLAVRGNDPDDGTRRAAPSARSSQQPTGGGSTSAPGRTTAPDGQPTGTAGPSRSGSQGTPPGSQPTPVTSAGPASAKGEGGGRTQGQVTRLPVTVLNNTTTTGLARQAADEFAAGGWPIARVGNFTGRIPVTTVYFTPGHADEERAANALAAAFPRITRVLPRYEGLPPSVTGVVVVLAPDWLG
jgi:hypothetical protein